jgi:potassium channel subfamily K
MALAMDWRTTVSSSSTEAEGMHIADPTWLVAVNGISLGLAIIANFSLLGQMTDQIRYSISAPITIVGWLASSFMLIGLVAATPAHLPLPDTGLATYSQAFYYACFAAAIYLILSVMLMATATAVYVHHYSLGYHLTMSQRSLMLQTMLFLGYLLAAGAVYSHIEGWDFLDSVYYVNVTLFTIGFGDFSPKTHLGRSLFFPMAVGGILFVGLIIASIRTLVLESGSRKISIRMVEVARDNALKKYHTRVVAEDDETAELERREEEFNIMRRVQLAAGRRNRMISLAVSASVFFLLWFIGAVVFWKAENATGGEDWSYFETMYFTYVSLITVGYGDFYPQTNSAKPSFVFWSLVALPALTVLIGAVGDAVSDFVAWFTLWLGENLPESFGFLHGLKKTSQKKKDKDGAFQLAKPPGFMDEGQPKPSDFDDPVHATAVAAIGADKQNNMDEKDQPATTPAAANDSNKIYLTIKEMKNVLQHLDASPPRKYTYAEWTWFLKLIDEDEATPEGHRRPWHPLNHIQSPLRDQKHHVWSWLGQESPLMSMEDEPKWVLGKLMEVVEREVKKSAREEDASLELEGQRR